MLYRFGMYGLPVYVFQKIARNQRVAEDLRSRRAVFVESTFRLPKTDLLQSSTHEQFVESA